MASRHSERTPTEQPETGAPGAVPPTGGTAPENAKPVASTSESASSAVEDLVDGIDLLLRAARKTLRAADPRLEAAAESALERLRELDERATIEARKKLGIDTEKIESIAREFGRELTQAVEHITTRINQSVEKHR
jgi:hypothetical protein